MSDAIKKLHDYLAKSPSVIYPEDVLAYLPAIEAENAQLREQGERLFDKTLELGTENSKLRELAKILANCAAGHGCDYCPINGGHGHVDEIDMCESVHDRIHELGIEV